MVQESQLDKDKKEVTEAFKITSQVILFYLKKEKYFK